MSNGKFSDVAAQEFPQRKWAYTCIQTNGNSSLMLTRALDRTREKGYYFKIWTVKLLINPNTSMSHLGFCCSSIQYTIFIFADEPWRHQPEFTNAKAEPNYKYSYETNKHLPNPPHHHFTLCIDSYNSNIKLWRWCWSHVWISKDACKIFWYPNIGQYLPMPVQSHPLISQHGTIFTYASAISSFDISTWDNIHQCQCNLVL